MQLRFSPEICEGRDRRTGRSSGPRAGRSGVRLELRTAGACRSLRVRPCAGEVRARFRGRVEQGDEPRSVRSASPRRPARPPAGLCVGLTAQQLTAARGGRRSQQTRQARGASAPRAVDRPTPGRNSPHTPLSPPPIAIDAAVSPRSATPRSWTQHRFQGTTEAGSLDTRPRTAQRNPLL